MKIANSFAIRFMRGIAKMGAVIVMAPHGVRAITQTWRDIDKWRAIAPAKEDQ